MKKKMTVLGVLALAVAVTASQVGGTYAKYVSSVDYTDQARVAKFQLTGAGEAVKTIDLFAKSYTYNGEKYVQTLADDKVIAPGTKGSVTLDVTGTFETAYTTGISIEYVKDIAIYFGLDENGRVTTIQDDYSDATPYAYNPITYKIYGVNADGSFNTDKVIETNGFSANYGLKDHKYLPGEVTGRHEYALEWTWNATNSYSVEKEDGTTVTLKKDDVNKLDTYLGEKGTDKVEVNVSIVAEQVADNHAEA